MQAFAKLGESLEKGHEGPPDVLLRIIANGLIVDYQRHVRRRPEQLPLAQVSEEQLGSDTTLTPAVLEFRQRFDAAVRALPAEDRDAFILTQLRGLTQQEAADVYHVDQVTISRRAERARQVVISRLSDA